MINANRYINARTNIFSENYLEAIKRKLEQLIASSEAQSEFYDYGIISISNYDKISTSKISLDIEIDRFRAGNPTLFSTLEAWLEEFGWRLIFKEDDKAQISKIEEAHFFRRNGTYYLVPSEYMAYGHDQ